MNNNKVIPIFFAVDDCYIPFLAVGLRSLIDHSSEEYEYLIKILNTNVSEENKKKIKKYEKENINIEFVDLNYYINKVKEKLYTRDYYTKTTYFRLFLPELYPQYDKVLYLDSDIIILDDIANLYNIDIGDNLVGAIPDDIIQNGKEFQEYAEKVVGVATYKKYFNAGILVMNLDELRKFKFQEKFLYLLGTIKFSVAQDQDYLNRICKGRVKYIDNSWDVMPAPGRNKKDEELKLIHYNLTYKPWHRDDVPYKEFFWEYAKKTEFFEYIQKIKDNYTEADRFADMQTEKNLVSLAVKESECVGDDRANRKPLVGESDIEKSKERLEILEKIKKLEREGKFDIDAENDPPNIVLTPENVDYLKEKMSSKFKTKVANTLAETFANELLRKNKLIIKEVRGIENLEEVKTGGIITCNHFNPFDAFTVEMIFKKTEIGKQKKLYKIIREGNYTNFPGFYGFLFRNCYTLPLSSNTKTMENLLNAIKKILENKDFILIYPEQSMWWNYKKPKPLKDGAFKFAVKNNVPIIPIFITMEESNIIGEDGFPVMEYIVNIEKPIYKDKKLTDRENINKMRDKNFAVWKDIYEKFYDTPLKYTTLVEE